MWVRLKVIKYVSEGGKQVTKYPGEWVKVGNQLAKSWLAAGDAERPDMPTLEALPGCGAVVMGNNTQMKLPNLDVVYSDKPYLEFGRTLLWSGISFRGDLLATGFMLLDTWELASPLRDYKTLARDIGTEQERVETEALIHDLRVPVYDTRMIFVRRCSSTRDLIDAWTEEEGNRDLAFLRALWKVKPLVLALPCTWLLP